MHKDPPIYDTNKLKNAFFSADAEIAILWEISTLKTHFLSTISNFQDQMDLVNTSAHLPYLAYMVWSLELSVVLSL